MNHLDKVISLYKYIKELNALKYKVVTNVNQQNEKFFIRDIPNDPENISFYYRDSVEDASAYDTVLLEVRKPEFQKCPDLPNILKEWLLPDWDRYTNEPKHREFLKHQDTGVGSDTSEDLRYKDFQADESAQINNTKDPAEPTKEITEYFNDSPERVKAYGKWIVTRVAWCKSQEHINKTRMFFTRLFKIHTDLEREPETLELMIGEGIIKSPDDTNINHPVLIKRVKMSFDAVTNIISIHDTDTEPELYTLLLQELGGINHAAVKDLKEELHDSFYHPLDRNDTPSYLEILTHKLSPRSAFIEDQSKNIHESDKLITALDPVYFVRRKMDGALKAIENIILQIEKNRFIPGHLIDLVEAGVVEIPENNNEQTIDEQLAASCGENPQILLSKSANREQLEIAERIELYNAVLVQGPPGTGKTHTIANLLGHFLAQGKNVLVTSHTKKALSVLKEQVPHAIQDLCVSILDDSNLDMNRSVDGISEYLSKCTATELKKRLMQPMTREIQLSKNLPSYERKYI